MGNIFETVENGTGVARAKLINAHVGCTKTPSCGLKRAFWAREQSSNVGSIIGTVKIDISAERSVERIQQGLELVEAPFEVPYT